MWLLLCEHNDVHALWAAEGLRARDVEPLAVVSSEQLAYALRWEHRLDGSVRTEVVLADGRTLRSDDVRGVLNRLQQVPTGHFARASEADRAYAQQELTALILSFLHGLPGPMLNRPVGQSPSGPWLHLSEWTHEAAGAGLAVRTYTRTSRQAADTPEGLAAAPRLPVETLIVVGDGVVGRSAPSAAIAGSRRLAVQTGASLLGVQFVVVDGDWLFAGATPYPQLACGGEPLLDLIASTLLGEESS